jgi:hypothetical protein
MAAGLSFYSPPAISSPELMVAQRRPVELALQPIEVEVDLDSDVQRWPSWTGCASKTGDSDGGCTWITASEGGGTQDVYEGASTPDGVEVAATEAAGESAVLDGAAEEELQRIVEAAATRNLRPPLQPPLEPPSRPPTRSPAQPPARPLSHHMPDPPGTPTWWHYFYAHPLSCRPGSDSRQSLPSSHQPPLDHRQQQQEEDPVLVVSRRRKGKRRKRWDLGAFGDVVRCVGSGVLWVVSCGGLLDCHYCTRRRGKVG